MEFNTTFNDADAAKQVRSNLSEANYTLEQALAVAHRVTDDGDHVYLSFRAYHTSLVLLNTMQNGRPAGRWPALRARFRTLWALAKVALNSGERAAALHQTYEEWREVRRREDVRRERERYGACGRRHFMPLCKHHH